MAYTYDPSQNIQQGFQQAASGVGNIFTQIIAQQQRDYNLAENAFQNIEALKKNLNIFGQKSITAKANDLLGKTSSAIMKNGKLDYSALGDIRQQVSEIGDLKQGYDVGAKEYERMLQLGVANKDNLVSFEKFYKDLSSKMGDENLVKNPQDLQRALADTYTNNLDATKIYGKGFLNTNPYNKIERDVINPKTGALMRVQGELPKYWDFDVTTGKIIPPPPKTMIVNGQQVTMDYADQELARIQSTSPDQLVLMKNQLGSAAQNLSDKDIVKTYIDRVPMSAKAVQVKSADELKEQGLQVEKLAFDVATQGEEFAMKKALNQAQINRYNSMGTKGGEAFSPQSLADISVNVNANGKSAIFGGDGIKIDVPYGTRRNKGVPVPFKAVNVRTLPNGKKQVGGYFLDADNKPRNPQLAYVDFDEKDKIIQNSLNSAINRMDKNDRQYIQTQLSVYDRVQIPQKGAAASPKANEAAMTDEEILGQMPDGYSKAPDAKAKFVAAFKKLNNIK